MRSITISNKMLITHWSAWTSLLPPLLLNYCFAAYYTCAPPPSAVNINRLPSNAKLGPFGKQEYPTGRSVTPYTFLHTNVGLLSLSLYVQIYVILCVYEYIKVWVYKCIELVWTYDCYILEYAAFVHNASSKVYRLPD